MLLVRNDNCSALLFRARQARADQGGNQSEDWHFNTANTNWAYYQTSIMAPYMGGQVGVYKCPADSIASDNGPRVRTVSMQGQMGNLYMKSTTQGYIRATRPTSN